jgi:hypothetical protein
MKEVNEQKDQLLTEQKAPLKNTDHAFVQVGSHGEPVIPAHEQEEREQQKREEDQPPA